MREPNGSSMATADLLAEALAGLFARPGRTALTILGTVIGLAALVATVGLSQTAGNRIVGRFDELAATEVEITSKPPGLDGITTHIPWDAPERLERLNGIVTAGNISTIDVAGALVTTSPVVDPTTRTSFNLSVYAMSPGAFDVVHAQLSAGRLFDSGHSARSDRVIVLGAVAAQRLGITSVGQLPAVRIGDDVFLVAGILQQVSRQPDLVAAIMMPEGTARRLYRLEAPETTLAETAVGAASVIGRQAPLALRPDNPRGLEVSIPPEQQRVREAVRGDLNLLFLVLGGVSLLVGAIGIANVTLVSVMERTGEIGLRRSLGATKRHIASQFLLESSAMGLVGGIAGAAIGTLVVIGVAASQSWTPVLSALVPLGAPAAGALIGLLAGIHPSLRAASMEPVEALRAAT